MGKAVLGSFLVLATMAGAFGQTLTQSAKQKMDGQPQIVPGAQMQRMAPLPLRSKLAVSGALGTSSSPIRSSNIQGNPGGLPGIDSIPNFTRAFSSQGQVWPFTMMGNDPSLGHSTRIPVKIIAVSLELQNEDLVTTTKVPIAPFDKLTLHSPNFEEADYSSGKNIQYADAVQRAEFFNSMKK